MDRAKQRKIILSNLRENPRTGNLEFKIEVSFFISQELLTKTSTTELAQIFCEKLTDIKNEIDNKIEKLKKDVWTY